MTNLIQRDLKHIWHPCSQMKDYENFPPVLVQSAQGSYITLDSGKKIIDAISSWWCKSLGHGHPLLKNALQEQLEKFEHVIFANTTHQNIIELSEKLANLSPSLDKVFYASDGSCVVEVAMKMSLHSRKILGENNRTRFMSLQNAYHGETGLALAVSDLGLYRNVYKDILIDTLVLKNIPYVHSRHDPLWQDCSAYWPEIEAQLDQHKTSLTAILIEPILQGAGGMQIYSADFLKRLRKWTKENNVHLIADEIMTGIGRTGLPLACQHAEVEPDFLCLGKALTSGFLPLSAMLTSTEIYHLFYDNYEQGKSFLHSHTHSGNALATSVALATLNIMETENIYQRVQEKEKLLHKLMQEVAEKTGALKNIRHIGMMVAADLITENPQERRGFKVFQQAMKLGAFLRPLGNTLYWLPPLNISKDTLYELQKITCDAILVLSRDADAVTTRAAMCTAQQNTQ